MDEEKENYLKNIYYNPKNPASFSGINKLLHFIKKDGKFNITKDEIQKWLQGQEIHTTNRLVFRTNKRPKVISPYIDYMWDLDTASFKNFAKSNKKIGYFILAIDIMSRYIWTKAITTPSGEEVKSALKTILKEGRKPDKIRTDKGSEFSNKTMKDFFRSSKIDHFVTQNEVKANYAERAIQTIKARLMKYMRSKQTHRWIEELDNVTSAYNNSFHRSIKQTPASVTKKDEIKLWKLLYTSRKPFPPPKSYKFKVDDIVRISKLREQFQRYYSEHWTNELFIISGREMKQNIPTYQLKDYAGDKIEGVFYEKELQRVYVDENTTYNIEKILATRKRRGMERESLVRWMGWPKKFDSWIPSKDVTSYS